MSLNSTRRIRCSERRQDQMSRIRYDSEGNRLAGGIGPVDPSRRQDRDLAAGIAPLHLLNDALVGHRGGDHREFHLVPVGAEIGASEVEERGPRTIGRVGIHTAIIAQF